MSEERGDAESNGPTRQTVVPGDRNSGDRVRETDQSRNGAITDDPKPQPPLSTRACADLIGVSSDFILDAIKDGELVAEVVRRKPGARALYRVHEDDFVAWLKKIGWSRLPRTGTG